LLFSFFAGIMAHTTELITYLEKFITEERKNRFSQVLSERMGHLRIVVENIFQGHNASAVIRSCDCFGIQHVHFIENRNQLRINDDIALGSSNWVSIHRHNEKENNSVSAIQQLKAQGYRIVATTPHRNDCTISELPVDQKMALVFGTELEGISEEVISSADEFVKIPMYGFTESFNISVSAALCMYELSTRIRKTVPDYHLTDAEKQDVYFNWLRNSIDFSEAIIRDYEKRIRS
jgi:tRNA (guanosine-2'-O-)-methyltransferase